MKRGGLFIIILALSLTFLLTYFISTNFGDVVPQHGSFERRFNQLLEQMPEITSDSNKKTLFLGTSIYQHFLDPRHFDNKLQEQGIESKSYNLGFEGNVGSGFYTMVQRLDTEFKEKKAKFKNIVIELSPACHNHTYYRNHQFFVDIRHPQIFMDRKAWIEMLLHDAPSAAFLLFSQFLRPIDWEKFIPAREWLSLRPRGPVKWPGIVGFWSKKEFYDRPEWNPATAGLTNWNLPTSEKLFQKLLEDQQKQENWEYMIMRYRFGNGIYSYYGYETNLVNYYIESVKKASEMADNVYLLILPYAPSFQKYVDQYVDYNYMIDRLKKETKAKIIDYSKAIPGTDKDFADAMHLRYHYLQKHIELLAEDLSKK